MLNLCRAPYACHVVVVKSVSSILNLFRVYLKFRCVGSVVEVGESLSIGGWMWVRVGGFVWRSVKGELWYRWVSVVWV